MSSSDLTVICITPVRNEAWILERFLACAGLWADHIMIADHGSTDGSREIALAHPKVTLVDHRDLPYDDGGRRGLLIDHARELSGSRVLISLDADEALTANWETSEEWHRALRAPPGTVLRFRWANLMPGLKAARIPAEDIAFGYVDDGATYHAGPMHPQRLPEPADAPQILFENVRVLHYQYADHQRMKSKQRWYQCSETLMFPKKRPIQIYRQYHHMDVVHPEETHDVDAAWFAGYETRGIDMHSVKKEGAYRWDQEVLDWLVVHGTSRFRKLDVWDVDWSALAGRLRIEGEVELNDPRGPIERAMFAWLRKTQARSLHRRVRLVQRLLIPFGW